MDQESALAATGGGGQEETWRGAIVSEPTIKALKFGVAAAERYRSRPLLGD
jgi:hypothetical protein